MTDTFVPSRQPSINEAKQNVSFRVIRMNMGDGYSQRTRDGINADNIMWELAWNNITSDIADELVSFFKSKGGAESFYWTPPREGTMSRWLCTAFSRTVIDYQLDNVTATFERVYDLQVTE